MPDIHDDSDLDQLIDLYAFGALDGDEAAAVEAYLARSARARALLAQNRDVMAALALGTEQRDPPPGAYDRFKERVLGPAADGAPLADVAETAPQPRRPAAPPAQRQRRWISRFALALALILALGVGGWRLFGANGPQLNLALAGFRERAALLTDPSTRTVALQPIGATAGQTRVMLNVARKTGVLVSSGMEPLAAGRTYQVWMIADGKPISMGTFDVDAAGRAAVFMETLPAPGGQNAIGITIEPSGGSPAPTSAPILAGNL